MQHKTNTHSKLSRASITVVIIAFCITFLSACVMWVRTPNDHDNGRHRGEHHDRRWLSKRV